MISPWQNIFKDTALNTDIDIIIYIDIDEIAVSFLHHHNNVAIFMDHICASYDDSFKPRSINHVCMNFPISFLNANFTFEFPNRLSVFHTFYLFIQF